MAFLNGSVSVLYKPIRHVDIYGKLGHPYYIYVSDYQETDIEISIFHHLCHAINLLGRDAYLIGPRVVHAHLKTPLLTDEIYQSHRQRQVVPIGIYFPSIVDNPLNLAVVTQDDWSNFPIINSAVFKPPAFRNMTEQNIRSGHYLYLKHYPREHVAFKKLPADIQLLPCSLISLVELAQCFQQALALYTYEWSLTCVQAMLCGCPVIFLPDAKIPGLKKETLNFEHFYGGRDGSASIDEPDGLARAQSTVARMAVHYAQAKHEFWPHLTHFIDQTQDKAEAVSASAAPVFKHYENWLALRRPSNARLQHLKRRIQAQTQPISIGIAIVDLSGDTSAVSFSLESIGKQIHTPDVVWVFSSKQEVQWPTQVQAVLMQKPWPTALNLILKQSNEDWIFILPAGETLEPHALLLLVERILCQPTLLACYADEDCQENDGFNQPWFKPDLNIERLRSQPYLGRCLAFNREMAVKQGGMALELGEFCLIDLVFKLIEQGQAQEVGHLPEVLSHASIPLLKWLAREENIALATQTLALHLTRCKINCELSPANIRGTYRINYLHPQQPCVSIIVPTRDQIDLLKTLVQTLSQHAGYTKYELLLVDNNSQSHEAVIWFKAVEEMKLDQIKILRWPQPFNFGALNNFAARYAKGEYLLFLNNDVEVTDPNWLSEMLNHAQRSEVGVVGAKLKYPAGGIQHAGLVLGMQGTAGHAFHRAPDEAIGYANGLQIVQDVGAVSAACLMVRKSLFKALGGFDETSIGESFADVDLCLKVQQAGYRVLWTPYAYLNHRGGGTRQPGRTFPAPMHPSDQAIERLYAKWLPQLVKDMAYSPRLNLERPGFNLDDRCVQCFKPVAQPNIPIVLGCYEKNGAQTTHERVIELFKALEEGARIEGGLMAGLPTIIEEARLQPDVVVVQGWIGQELVRVRTRSRHFCKSFWVGEIDINQWVSCGVKDRLFMDDSITAALACLDRIVVSSEYLAKSLKSFHQNIYVRHDALPSAGWSCLFSERCQGKKPRVGWSSRHSCLTDLWIIERVIKKLAKEVEWVFLGPPTGLPFECEWHYPVATEQYPQKLASLNLNLAVLPFEDCFFNHCRSPLPILEFGACGVPVIMSDIKPFECDLPCIRVPNKEGAWIEAIRECVKDLCVTAKQGDELRLKVQQEGILQNQNFENGFDSWKV